MFFNLRALNRTTIQASLLALGILTGLTQSALAQSSPTAQAMMASNGTPAQAAVLRPVKKFTGAQNYMYETHALKSPASLPQLPEYRGGSKFESGLYYPKLRTGQCYLMRYQGKERAAEIMRSYRESLLQSGWEINVTQTNSKQLTAARKKDGLYCTLCVWKNGKPGFKSSFEIKYLATGSVLTQDN